MKKYLCLLLAALLIFSASACGGNADAALDPDHTVTVVGRDPDPSAEAEPEETPELPDYTELLEKSFDPENGKLAYYLALPADSGEADNTLALQSLLLSTGHTAENTEALLNQAGFEILTQKNYDKGEAAPDHTCAFTVARKTVLYGNERRSLLLTVIRGTNGGEWYSNFDIAPDRSGDSEFAENFLFAAEDVLLTLSELAEQEDDPLFLICGHSRGAACANLLGVLANGLYGEENVFAYTFASPGTVKAGADLPDSNIFNYLNPLDLVPNLPPADWGYVRAGRDILLPVPEGTEPPYGDALETLTEIAPTAEDYYSQRHSLTEAGLSEDGLTAFEALLLVGSGLAGLTEEAEQSAGISTDFGGLISRDSDLYPLAELLKKAADDDWKIGTEILEQHLPITYAELLTGLAE